MCCFYVFFCICCFICCFYSVVCIWGEGEGGGQEDDHLPQYLIKFYKTQPEGLGTRATDLSHGAWAMARKVLWMYWFCFDLGYHYLDESWRSQSLFEGVNEIGQDTMWFICLNMMLGEHLIFINSTPRSSDAFFIEGTLFVVSWRTSLLIPEWPACPVLVFDPNNFA